MELVPSDDATPGNVTGAEELVCAGSEDGIGPVPETTGVDMLPSDEDSGDVTGAEESVSAESEDGIEPCPESTAAWSSFANGAGR